MKRPRIYHFGPPPQRGTDSMEAASVGGLFHCRPPPIAKHSHLEICNPGCLHRVRSSRRRRQPVVALWLMPWSRRFEDPIIRVRGGLLS
jgi:hypothetical protein